MVITRVVEARITPPLHWLNNCPVPLLEGESYQAAIELALKQKAAIQLCNADKAALRDWVQGESNVGKI